MPLIIFCSEVQGGDLPTVRIEAGTPVPAISSKGNFQTKGTVSLPYVHPKSSGIPSSSDLSGKSVSAHDPFTQLIKKGLQTCEINYNIENRVNIRTHIYSQNISIYIIYWYMGLLTSLPIS